MQATELKDDQKIAANNLISVFEWLRVVLIQDVLVHPSAAWMMQILPAEFHYLRQHALEHVREEVRKHESRQTLLTEASFASFEERLLEVKLKIEEKLDSIVSRFEPQAAAQSLEMHARNVAAEYNVNTSHAPSASQPTSTTEARQHPIATTEMPQQHPVTPSPPCPPVVLADVASHQVASHATTSRETSRLPSRPTLKQLKKSFEALASKRWPRESDKYEVNEDHATVARVWEEFRRRGPGLPPRTMPPLMALMARYGSRWRSTSLDSTRNNYKHHWFDK